MRVIPAIDLRAGACVQLVGGVYEAERVRREDPVAVAREFRDLGFGALHVVDLDAALGRGSNHETVLAIAALGDLELQVGGGVRDEEAIARWLAAGVARVIVGTRAIEEPDWLAAMARAYPERLMVAADARGTRVVTRGWTQDLELDVRDLVRSLAGLPLAGVLVTAVHREGRLAGADLELARSVIAATTLEVQIAGGIGSLDDLRALQALGAQAAITGMAAYTGALDLAQVAAEFAPLRKEAR